MKLNYKHLILLAVLLYLPIAIAQNDPGHDSLYIIRDGDTISGDFNFTGTVIVQTPVDGSSPATRDYVDSSVAGSGNGSVMEINTGDGLTGGPITDTGTISFDTVWGDARYLRIIGGVLSGALNMGNNIISNVSTPIDGSDVATKDYVDTLLDTFSNGSVMEINTGDGLTGGPITDTGTISFDTVWGDARYLRIIGGVLSGALNMGNNIISNVSDPVDDSDVATKAYVDSLVGGGGDMSSFTIAGDTGSSVVSDGQILTIQGGTGITTSESSRTVTINVDDDYVPYTGATQNLDLNQRNVSNFNVLQGHNESYGILNNGTATIIGYIGDLI
ncbi:MAG: hypothetical protein ACMXX9_01445 [Candidatus Woesearchaeota archaeon]